MVSNIKRKRGFFVFAQNSGDKDYLKLAYALALSLKMSQSTVPWLSVGITPGMRIPRKYKLVFDEIIEIPGEDESENYNWKLQNEYKVYEMSPYEETIKLDADMLFTTSVDEWWNLLSKRDMWATTQVINYKGELITNDYYRKVFTANKLPNIYSAFFYFKKTDATERYFQFLEMIFKNWPVFVDQFLTEEKPNCFSTDVAYALAAKLTVYDEIMCNDNIAIPTFVHMKSQLQNISYLNDENWSKYLNTYFSPELQLRIVNHLQIYPVHYHIKEWMTDEIISFYERAFFND